MAPIHLAIKKCSLEIFKILLHHPGIDVNSKMIKYKIEKSKYPLYNHSHKIEKSLLDFISILTRFNNEAHEYYELLLSKNEFDANSMCLSYFITHHPPFINYEKEEEPIWRCLIFTELRNDLKELFSSERFDANKIIRSTSIEASIKSITRRKKEISALFFIFTINKVYLQDFIDKTFPILLENPNIDVNTQFVILNDSFGENFTINESKKFNILHYLVSQSHVPFTKLLLENPKIDVNLKRVEKHVSKIEGKEVVEIREETPLHISAAIDSTNSKEIIQLLLKNPSINLRIPDSNNNYPYRLATDPEIQILLKPKRSK